MDRDFAILSTGQTWAAASNILFMQAVQRGISPLEYQILMQLQQLDQASLHTKPVTNSCESAVLFRVPNNFEVAGVGTELEHECKGRIFAAKDALGDDIVIANFYMADSKLSFRKLAESLPRNSGDSLITIPKSAFTRPKNNVDPMDLLSLGDSYAKASELLGLGLGEINPFSVTLKAKERGVKLLCVYDERLANWKDYITNNAGSRTLGTYAVNGVDYIELAMSQAQNIEIGGKEVAGYVVADVAERSKNIEMPSAIRELYKAVGNFEKALLGSLDTSSPPEK